MRTLALIALLAGSLFGQQADWRFAHPDATLVGGFRPMALLDSPMVAEVLAQQQKDPQVGLVLAMARGLMGGVTEVRFSLQDNGTKDADVVAMIVGRFDEATLAALGQNQAKWKRLDANTLLMGTGASLDKAFARARSTSAGFQSRALDDAELLSKYDLWVSGRVPDSLPAAAAGLSGAGSVDLSKLGLKTLAFGMSMRDGVEIEMTVQAATPAMADALIKGAHEAEKAQAPTMQGTLKSYAENSTAHFRVSVPKDAVTKAMQQRAATGTTLPSLGLPQAAPAPVAPKRKTIIIDGLDNGPKEIAIQK